jgi:hypothetical protein
VDIRASGELLDAPPRVAPTEPAAKLGLNPVELVEQDGFCMVRLQPGGAAPRRLKLPHRRFAAAVTTDIDANWKAVVEAVLADEDYQFVWPLAFADEPEPGLGVMRQIVPRSSRTRIVDLIFGDAATDDFAACWRPRRRGQSRCGELPGRPRRGNGRRTLGAHGRVPKPGRSSLRRVKQPPSTPWFPCSNGA